MKKIRMDVKVLRPRMNPMEERGQSNHLYAAAVPVWYGKKPPYMQVHTVVYEGGKV